MTSSTFKFKPVSLWVFSVSLFTLSVFAGSASESTPLTSQNSAKAAAKPMLKSVSKSPTIPASSAEFTHQLLALLLDRNTDAKLYEQGNNPWPGGAYKFEVFKDGKPSVSSGAAEIRVILPMKIVIAGDVGNALLNFKMACSANFTTVAEVRFTPKKAGSVAPLMSQITLPIPPVSALCDGSPVPIDTYLKNLFDQNKQRVQAELDAKINVWLSE